VTTLVDLQPFNGVRFYTRRERLAEAGVNLVLMGLAPIGYAFQLHGLMLYGAIYYIVLFAFEIVIWWIPYFTVPTDGVVRTTRPCRWPLPTSSLVMRSIAGLLFTSEFTVAPCLCSHVAVAASFPTWSTSFCMLGHSSLR
jgi:hypothetical protein